MPIKDVIDRVARIFREPASADAGAKPMAEQLPDVFIVDDEADIRRMIAMALGPLRMPPLEFDRADGLAQALAIGRPRLVFIDISLEGSDAIDVIRQLSLADYKGLVQLISGRKRDLLEEIEIIGRRHGLDMLPSLTKPFRLEAIRASGDRAGLDRGAPVERAAQVKVSLAEALDRGWMELWYQPKIDLRTKQFSGAECLSRVRHPVHGVLAPASFLPGAPEVDLLALTEWALITANRDWRRFNAADLSIKQAVNLPVSALIKSPIVEILREERPRDANWRGIILEVTEDEIIRDIAWVHEVATQLRIYGAELAVDDFGAGYSSLARLKALPFCEIKLDQSFVANCAVDAHNKALCQMVIDLAHRFNSLAVAEGVETSEDVRALRDMGCDLAQGYVFAKPMPRDDLIDLLQRRASRRAS